MTFAVVRNGVSSMLTGISIDNLNRKRRKTCNCFFASFIFQNIIFFWHRKQHDSIKFRMIQYPSHTMTVAILCIMYFKKIIQLLLFDVV